MKRLFIPAAIFAVVSAGFISTPVAHAQTPNVISAKGNPYLNDFLVTANKRADLRLKKATRGIDVAFTEWLRAERPHAYRKAAEQVAARNKAGKQTASAPGAKSIKNVVHTADCCKADAKCCTDGAKCCVKEQKAANCCEPEQECCSSGVCCK